MEKEIKDFARWIIIHTKDVNTMGACRLYENKVYNLDELYNIYINLG